MKWNHSEVIALAKQSCAQCQGSGMGRSLNTPCNCVLRAIFRACYRKFRFCAQAGPHISTARLERIPGAVNGPMVFGRKSEEYIADFYAISRRALTDPLEYCIFRFHFLLGADWKLCCGRLKMERGDFFHSVYRIQQKLGRAFRETSPYGIFPLDEYFGAAVRMERMKPCVVSTPVRPPRFPDPGALTRKSAHHASA